MADVGVGVVLRATGVGVRGSDEPVDAPANGQTGTVGRVNHAALVGDVHRVGNRAADGHADVPVHSAGVAHVLPDALRRGEAAGRGAAAGVDFPGDIHEGAGGIHRAGALDYCLFGTEKGVAANGPLLGLADVGNSRGALRGVVRVRVCGRRQRVSEQFAFSPNAGSGKRLVPPQGTVVVLLHGILVLAGTVVNPICHGDYHRLAQAAIENRFGKILFDGHRDGICRDVFVQCETGYLFAADIPVLPVLDGGAAAPNAGQLGGMDGIRAGGGVHRRAVRAAGHGRGAGHAEIGMDHCGRMGAGRVCRNGTGPSPAPGPEGRD